VRRYWRSRSFWVKWMLILSILFYGSQASATENILDFHSRITVNSDASADVTETITVNSEQIHIRHGIERTLLLSFQDEQGVVHATRYHINAVGNNGISSDYHTDRSPNRLFIFVGSKDTMLPPGVYVYTLQYHVANVVSLLNDRDEFYWNVTGNAWEFSIKKASVDLALPEGIDIKGYAGYTGSYGTKGNDYTVGSTASNQIHFETTDVLRRNEGLTIAVAWPKGFIQLPTFFQTLRQGGDLIGVEVFLFLLIYYIAVWMWESREPESGAIIPLFQPPVGLGPAAIRYISQMNFDDKAFTTAIISMATKGYLTINQGDSGEYTLTKKSDDVRQLSHGELAVAATLFDATDSVTLSSANHQKIYAAKLALKRNLKLEFENTYFVTHAVYLMPGILLSVLGLLALAREALSAFSEVVSVVTMGLICSLYCMRFYRFLSDMKDLWKHPSSLLLKELGASLVVLVYIAILVYVSYDYFMVFTPLELFLFAAILLLNVIFYHILRVHTPAGRKLMDQIEGFKMYLAATEQSRFDTLNPPDKTPELFEKYFPYAIALNVENAWSEQFYSVLTTVAHPGQHSYRPLWYVGSAWSATTPAAFAGTLNSGMTFSISASSGGGASGGGGGGGGGGGW
jgi:uncharacterized membrane protein YgcG